jgi:hypothetical protein
MVDFGRAGIGRAVGGDAEDARNRLAFLIGPGRKLKQRETDQ